MELFQTVSKTFPSIISLNPMEYRSQPLSMGTKLRQRREVSIPRAGRASGSCRTAPSVLMEPGPGEGWGREGSEREVKVLAAQSCPILCDPVDCSPPGSSVMGFCRQEHQSLAIPFLRGSSQPRDGTQASCTVG